MIDDLKRMCDGALAQDKQARNPMLLAQIAFFAACEEDRAAALVMRTMERDCAALIEDHRILARATQALTVFAEEIRASQDDQRKANDLDDAFGTFGCRRLDAIEALDAALKEICHGDV